jgi:4-diphosphocytidyl-2-C-methyl-D-erythritol kinase
VSGGPHARVRALAPAKINPRLEVLGRRADGYHEIRTWMLAVDLCDEIEAHRTATGAVRISTTGPQMSADIPDDRTNLAARAAELALAAARADGVADATTGVDLALVKNIPSQSGLGGASSDAAAAWLATSAALGFEPRAAATSENLARLGSDTVFFARAAETGAGTCTGRGEIVSAEPSPENWSIVLLTPAVPCPTSQVYAALGIHLRAPASLPTLRPEWSTLSALSSRELLENQLEPAALAAVPGLTAWRRLLDDEGCAHFRLTGSGSSFFGLYETDETARAALDGLERRARASALVPRLARIVHPARHGARLVRDC